MRGRAFLLAAVFPALAATHGIAAEGDHEAELDQAFHQVERRLNGKDSSIRDGCRAARRISLEDRTPETSSGVVERVTDITVEAANSTAMRPCARSVAHAGVVEGWMAVPGTAGGFSLSIRLRRAHRDDADKAWRTADDQRRSAARLTALWKTRVAAAESLGAEVYIPDLVRLREARWNAGNLAFEGSADDARFADAYRQLLERILGPRLHPEWKIDVVAPDDRPANAGPPAVPTQGTLRVAYRSAPPGAVLRALAELDRRDFVIPAAGPRDGTIGGGWNGIVHTFAEGMERDDLQVGAIDVMAPKGTAGPARVQRTGSRVSLDLEAVDPARIAGLLATAGQTSIEFPAGLPPLDVHLQRVPWDQALQSVALAEGCSMPEASAAKQVVHCSAAPVEGRQKEEGEALLVPPLERYPASGLRVAALATRNGDRWVAVLATPAGQHVTARTGVPVGLEGGHVVVDESGVSFVLARADTAGNAVLATTSLPF